MISLGVEKGVVNQEIIHSYYKAEDKFSIICSFLSQKRIEYSVDRFESVFDKGNNIIVDLRPHSGENYILISAHYDDIGIYDNCGGVLLMMSLVNKLSLHRSLGKNVVFIFSDQEEYFQQGMQKYLRNNKLGDKIDYHLNIDGIGIGRELVLYHSTTGHFVIDWLSNGEKTILLTDNTPFADLATPSYHIFSCLKNHSQEIINEQSITSCLKPYFDEQWCLENFNLTSNISIYLEKLIHFLSLGMSSSSNGKTFKRL